MNELNNSMLKEDRNYKESEEGKVRVIIANFVRAILILAVFIGIYSGRRLVLIIAGLALIFTFVPGFVEYYFEIKVPAKFEVMILLFIYGLLLLADVKGVFAEYFWFGTILNFASAIALGFVGFTVLYVLHKEEKINASPIVIAIFAFSFAVAVGVLWQIFEFLLDSFFGFRIQTTGFNEIMGDLVANSIGSLVVSLAGYYYIKNGKIRVASTFIEKLIYKNPGMFKLNETEEDHSRKIKGLIDFGENSKVEFKSSLRTNLYTKEIDKKIEHSVLKTVAAYLNSDGGTLLIGIGDKGEILGLDSDAFQSADKLNLHLNNLIKTHIGNEFLPFIKYDLISVDGKSIMKVECKESDKHVFLKRDGAEEFYVRNGPSSSRLDGSALIDYVRNNFRNS